MNMSNTSDTNCFLLKRPSLEERWDMTKSLENLLKKEKEKFFIFSIKGGARVYSVQYQTSTQEKNIK